MAKAPIQTAAKFQKERVQMTTLQYCLPSYTSTIRALQYLRSRVSQCRQNPSILIVDMPTTPGASSLSGVTIEAGEIEYSLWNFGLVEMLGRSTAERVLQALPGYSIAHFACHGVSTTNPANSHILLLKESISNNGETISNNEESISHNKESISHNCLCTEEADKLHVKDIAALKLPAARLAYLSACSTANSTSSRLIDEVTHIVSSFHIAGFPHVTGKL